MKKGVLFAVVLLSIFMLAGNVLGAYLPVPYSITLDTNINGDVEILADNIVLDCAGHSIIGSGTGNGINIINKKNVTIENCIVATFGRGVWIRTSSDVSIISSNISNNVQNEGILIDGSSNSKLISNLITNNKDYGVYIVYSSQFFAGADYNTIYGNTINKNGLRGVFMQGSRYNNITSNAINNNGRDGIYADVNYAGTTIVGLGNNIRENIINNNSGFGIYLNYNSFNVIDSNVIKNNGNGVSIWARGDRNILSSNIIKNNNVGLDIVNRGSSGTAVPRDTVIYNNLFNNPINILRNEGDYTKFDLQKAQCGTGSIYVGPILIQVPDTPNIVGGNCWGGNFWSDYLGIEIGSQNTGIGNTLTPHKSGGPEWDYFPLVGVDCGSSIQKSITLNRDLDDCSKGLNIAANNVVLDCAGHSLTGDGTGYGINATSRNNITIKNCKLARFSTDIYGVQIQNSILSNNIMSDSQRGITLSSSANVMIEDNTVYNTTSSNGFTFYSFSNSTIRGNNLYKTIQGIYCSPCRNLTITDNIIQNSISYGVELEDSNFNKVVSNFITNHSGYGIYIVNGLNNTIYNNFFNNTINAHDTGTNFWNTTKTAGTNIVGGPYIGGNFWSDYMGVDSTGDKIGDTLWPYKSKGNIILGGDYLPLVFVSGGVTCATITDCSILSQANCISPCCIFNISATPQCRKNCSSVNCADYITESNCGVTHADCCTWESIKGECYPQLGLHHYCKKDGIVNLLYEECDPGNATVPQNLSGQTCESQNHEPGTLSCTQSCMYAYGLCGDKCQQTQTTSSWTDTGESSKDNCFRTFNGVDKTCCPNDQTCYNVLDTSTNTNINTCVKSGVVRCGGLNGYQNEEDCNNFDAAIAEASVEEIPNTGVTCMATCTAPCTFARCLCVWDNNECVPGAEEVTIDASNNIIRGNQCRYSITEGTCNRGIKTITYKATATGPIQGLECADRSAEVSCFAATEIPFFNFWSLMVTITGIVVFYAIRRK
jgi:parallel beta-helix repeat protein